MPVVFTATKNLADFFLTLGKFLYCNDKLIPFNELTESQQREIASKGGKASVEAKRKRKTLKEELLLMLEDEEVQKSVAVALIQEAQNGNVKAFGMLRDTIGEAPVEKVQTTQTVVDLSSFSTDEIKAMLDDDIP